MEHEELKQAGISICGHLHKIVKAMKERVTDLWPGKMFLVLTDFYTTILKCFVDYYGRKKITRFENINRNPILKIFSFSSVTIFELE